MPYKRKHDNSNEPMAVSTPIGSMTSKIGAEAIPDVLNLYDTLPTQIAIESGKYILVSPQRSLDNTGKIYFKLKTDACQFLDPQNTYLYMCSRILKPDGTPIPATIARGADMERNPVANVAFVNGINHAWFKNIEVKINGQTIDYGDNMYAYRGDLENRLTYNTETKKGSLNMSGWDEEQVPFDEFTNDTPFPEAIVEPTEDHKEIMRRYLTTLGGGNLWTIGKIHSSIFDQPKLLPDHIEMEISLDRNSTKFVLLSRKEEREYKPEISSIFLYVKINKVDERVCKDIQSLSFSGKSYLYPIRRVKMMTFTHPAGGTEISIPDLLPGETEAPRRIFLTFVRESARTGLLNLDPFNYQHFNMRSIVLRVGGETTPFPEMDMDFENNKYILNLFGTLDAAGTAFTNTELGIDVYNYLKRNVIYGYDLQGTGGEPGEAFSRAQYKTVSLSCLLTASLGHAITLIVYAEFDSEIEITADKKIITHDNA